MNKRTHILALLLAGCVGFPQHVSYEPITPEPYFHTAWDRMERCVDGEVPIRGTFDEILWSVADDLRWNDAELAGLWIAPNRIILDRGFTKDLRTIGHEILHYMLGADHDHPVFARCDPLK